MDTKWRRFSRNRGTKIVLFLIFIISIAIATQTLLSVALKQMQKSMEDSYNYSQNVLEPLLCDSYEKSDTHTYQVEQDITAILNLIQYNEKQDFENYKVYLEETGLENSFSAYQQFHRDRYGDYGNTDISNIFYSATYIIDGTSKEISNLKEETINSLKKDNLAYRYVNDEQRVTNNRSDMAMTDVYYNLHSESIGEIKIDLIYPQEWLNSMQKLWNADRNQLIQTAKQMSILLIVGLFSLVFLTAVTGRKAGKEAAEICWLDRLWTEVVIGLIISSIVFGILIVVAQGEQYFYMVTYNGSSYSDSVWFLIIVLGGIGIAALSSIFLAAYLSLVRKLKAHCFWKTSLIGRLFLLLWRGIKYVIKTISALFEGNKFKKYRFQRTLFTRQLGFILGELVLWFITSISFGQMMYGYGGGGFVTLLFGFLAILLLAWYVNGYARANEDVGMICEQIEKICEGDLDSQLVLDSSSLLIDTAQQLNDIRGGMQKNIDSQIKSERMKIELITNVSHDLKTPLTSIISYIDLLKKEELSDEARDYVNILAQKSDRLKYMVSDVFDLAKTTSGEAKIEKEELNIRRLLEQTLADMEDRITKSNRTIRTSLCDQPISIQGDGKKLYRVFQNLIDNALKYSMENTRIFVEMQTKDDIVSVSVKNTASYEMDFTEEEVLERFARGDKSRTTDGNGLGLSIAKSFTEVCDGTFGVQIDGDQFKAVVTFPIIQSVDDEQSEEIIETQEPTE